MIKYVFTGAQGTATIAEQPPLRRLWQENKAAKGHKAHGNRSKVKSDLKISGPFE